jgi:hypothetical protein
MRERFRTGSVVRLCAVGSMPAARSAPGERRVATHDRRRPRASQPRCFASRLSVCGPSGVRLTRASVGGGLSLAGLLVLIGALPWPTALAQPLFGNAELPTGWLSVSVAIGDLDGDGDSDLVVANAGDDNVSVLLNHGDGRFADHVVYRTPHAPQCVAIGDLDGDGDADFAVANSFGDNVSLLPNHGDGTFAANVLYGVGGPRCVALGDLDGDGDIDLTDASTLLAVYGTSCS